MGQIVPCQLRSYEPALSPCKLTPARHPSRGATAPLQCFQRWQPCEERLPRPALKNEQRDKGPYCLSLARTCRVPVPHAAASLLSLEKHHGSATAALSKARSRTHRCPRVWVPAADQQLVGHARVTELGSPVKCCPAVLRVSSRRHSPATRDWFTDATVTATPEPAVVWMTQRTHDPGARVLQLHASEGLDRGNLELAD